MTVAELIAHLQTLPPDTPVCYSSCSEYTLLEAHEVVLVKLQPARLDGWVPREWGKTPPLPLIDYVLFP